MARGIASQNRRQHREGGCCATRTFHALTETAVGAVLLAAAGVASSTGIIGNSSGYFADYEPASAVVTGIGSDTFTWGAGDPSRLRFSSEVHEVEPGVVFPLASLTYYNGSIFGGTGIASVVLSMTVHSLELEPASFDFERTLKIIDTLNVPGDPSISADRVFLPTEHPTQILRDRRSGKALTLAILGWSFSPTVPSGESPDFDNFRMIEGGEDKSYLLARYVEACVPAPGKKVQMEEIKSNTACPPPGPKSATWGRFGVHEVLESSAGEKLQIKCSAQSQFKMYYTTRSGTRYRVGICPFESGCNFSMFWHAGDEDGDGKPDCFVKTRWVSRDYGLNDSQFVNADGINPWTGKYEPDDRKIDWAETVFDVASSRVTKSSYKFDVRAPYVGPNLRSDLCLDVKKGLAVAPEDLSSKTVQPVAADPLLGPDTEAFFDEVEARVGPLPEDSRMEFGGARSCDLNGDGACDDADAELFGEVLGLCRSEIGYLPSADSDANGCVMPADAYTLFAHRVTPIVRPGSQEARIVLNGKGVVPVAVISTDTFEATEIDIDTVEFGPRGAGETHGRGHWHDIDGDGRIDLVLHFRLPEIGLGCEDTTVLLRAETASGELVEGLAPIEVVCGADRRKR